MIYPISFRNNYNNIASSVPNNKSATPTLDELLNAVERENNKKNKSRLFWSPTASLISTGALFAGIAGTLYSLSKKVKSVIDNAGRQKLKNKYICIILAELAGYYALTLGIQKLFRLNTDKNYEKIKQDFYKINKDKDTEAYISEKPIKSNYIAARYNITSGKVDISRDYVDDPLLRHKIPQLIKHELTHGQQFELMARSEDGINKLNKISVENIAKSAINEISDADTYYQKLEEELKNDKTDRCAKIMMPHVNMSIKDLILTTNAINKNNNYVIPQIIDASHYQKVINKKGKLSQEEEQKAQQYLEAYRKYNIKPSLGVFNRFNKAYYGNILEEEARAAAKRKD